MTIQAKLCPTPEAKIPPFELWVVARFDRGGWYTERLGSERHADSLVAEYHKHGIPVRKFHLSDLPSPSVECEDAAVKQILTGQPACVQDYGICPISDDLRQAYRSGHAAGAASVVNKKVRHCDNCGTDKLGEFAWYCQECHERLTVIPSPAPQSVTDLTPQEYERQRKELIEKCKAACPHAGLDMDWNDPRWSRPCNCQKCSPFANQVAALDARYQQQKEAKPYEYEQVKSEHTDACDYKRSRNPEELCSCPKPEPKPEAAEEIAREIANRVGPHGMSVPQAIRKGIAAGKRMVLAKVLAYLKPYEDGAKSDFCHDLAHDLREELLSEEGTGNGAD